MGKSTFPCLPMPGHFPTPRSWTDAAKYIDRDAEMRQPLIAGRVGLGPSVEFEGFIRTFLEVPAIRTILADPSGAKVPQGPGLGCDPDPAIVARYRSGETVVTTQGRP